jgi:transposase
MEELMDKLSYRCNKKTGTTYVYKVEKSYWDKEKKSPRNKQTCLGKLDPETGELIPSKPRVKRAERPIVAPGVTAVSRVAGPYLLLEQITRQNELDKLLKKCFPDKWKLMLSLVYFIVHKGIALSRAESWSTACLHPFEDSIASQRISEFLREISQDERQHFLSLWLNTILEKDYLCYDITSVSSYGRHNEYTHFGYNRDNEPLEQINLAMLFGQKSNLPAYYRRMPGNISDVATLKTTLKSLNFLGGGRLHFVLDKGFYSVANIDELYGQRHKYTLALPIGRSWVEKYLDKHHENITSPANYLITGKDDALYAVTELHKWGEKHHRAYLHIYYNAERAAEEFDRFTRKIIAYRDELLAGNPVEKHQEFYRRYLILKETPKRGLTVTFNDKEIQKHRKRYSGFFCILSNEIKTAKEALSVYRTKDVVENSFDDLKNHLDMKRLRVHTAAAMDSRLFLQFIALIYISSIRNIIKNDKKLKYLTTREVMEEMETLTKITYSNRYGHILTETTPLQRHIIDVFGIQLHT